MTVGSAGYAKWGLSWTYDRYGNRTAQTVTAGTAPMSSLSISATTNRITSSGFSYDASGNMTNDALNTYTYDAESRIKSKSGGTSATYYYDGASLRVKKVVGSTTTRYIYSGTKVVAEYDNGAAVGLPTKEYIYSGSTLVVTLNGSTPTYHHQDHLSVRVNSNSGGTKVGDQGHYPFGESWYSSSTTTKWQFTSYERDSESGLDYAIFRYDSSRFGRFMTPDLLAGRISNPQSLNRYAYVQNDPVNRIDPFGLDDGPHSDDATCTGPDGTVIPCNDSPCFVEATQTWVPCPGDTSDGTEETGKTDQIDRGFGPEYYEQLPGGAGLSGWETFERIYDDGEEPPTRALPIPPGRLPPSHQYNPAQRVPRTGGGGRIIPGGNLPGTPPPGGVIEPPPPNPTFWQRVGLFVVNLLRLAGSGVGKGILPLMLDPCEVDPHNSICPPGKI